MKENRIRKEQMAPMKKLDIAAQVALRASLPKATAESAVNTLSAVLEDALASGDKVTIRGVGTFETKSREARTARNPRIGDVAIDTISRAPSFNPGKRLRDSLRQGWSV